MGRRSLVPRGTRPPPRRSVISVHLLFLFAQGAAPAFKPVPLASGNAAAKQCCKSAPPRAPPFLPSPNRVRGTVADRILLSSTGEAFRPLPTVGDRSAAVPAWPCAAGNR